jgi:hypothetical protein
MMTLLAFNRPVAVTLPQAAQKVKRELIALHPEEQMPAIAIHVHPFSRPVPKIHVLRTNRLDAPDTSPPPLNARYNSGQPASHQPMLSRLIRQNLKVLFHAQKAEWIKDHRSPS